ncbi:MAG: hypothetical protein ISR95_03495 [Candidatus Marinimicrobia bacterium]|nr:hypothetical protein [Candidatus Brocadiales bacterium]MBL7046679.1 hypothetical protein [Candidatus Neomarinimicrobiota bacterium]
MTEQEISNFTNFFAEKLSHVYYYDSREEKLSDIEFAVENMAYDIENGASLYTAFENACQQLYVESDGIELFI